MQMIHLQLPEGVVNNILGVFKSASLPWDVSNPVIVAISAQMEAQREKAAKNAAALEKLKSKAPPAAKADTEI